MYMLMHLKVKKMEMLLSFLQLWILAGGRSSTILFIVLFIFFSHFSFRLLEQGFLKEQYQAEKTDQKLPFGPPLGQCCPLPPTPQCLWNTFAPTPVCWSFSTASAKESKDRSSLYMLLISQRRTRPLKPKEVCNSAKVQAEMGHVVFYIDNT